MSRDWTVEELQAASAAMKAMGHMGYEEFCESIREVDKMELKVNLNGKSRKELAVAIAELTGDEAVYMKLPTCAYRIGKFTVGKMGGLTIEEGVTNSEVELLIERLADRGFEIEGFRGIPEEQEQPPQLPQKTQEPGEQEAVQEDEKLVVEIPKNAMSEKALENLNRIIESKGTLLRKALGTDNLTYEVGKERIRFPWFSLTGEADETLAYTQLISALADMARNSKRITAKEKEVDNEKYAFRCFLLRLGFIGQEYKNTRKVLMKNLEGNSAWKSK